MRAKVTVNIEFETDVPDDPESYEGADTPEARLAKEREYLSEDGDYLFQALAMTQHEVNVTVAPVAYGAELCTKDECPEAPRCSSGATVWHAKTDRCERGETT